MKHPLKWLSGALLAIALSQVSAGTLEEVKERGVVRCGVNGELPGLSFKDEAGQWSGIDVDFCRAVATAALGRADKVELIPMGYAERFDALRQGQIDLLSRNTTWTMSRDLDLGMIFTGVLYHDGQGFMVPRGTDILTALALSGKRVCAIADSTAPTNAERYFKKHRMELDLTLFETLGAAKDAYLAGKCEALTTDHSMLHSLRAAFGSSAAHRILPEVISKEPLSPAVRRDDDRWFDIVRWTLFLMLDAEEHGIDSGNVDQARARARTDEIKLLLDIDGSTSELLGLDKGWSYRVIRQVGNYAEIFERNLGEQSPLKIKRGLNALWNQGGIMYAPPTR